VLKSPSRAQGPSTPGLRSAIHARACGPWCRHEAPFGIGRLLHLADFGLEEQLEIGRMASMAVMRDLRNVSTRARWGLRGSRIESRYFASKAARERVAQPGSKRSKRSFGRSTPTATAFARSVSPPNSS